MYYLTKDDIIELHNDLILSYGGEKEILSENNLELCARNYKSRYFGQSTFQDLVKKAAALMNDINKLHPFVDGNKRTAFHCANTFLKINDYSIRSEDQDVVSTSLKSAACDWEIDRIEEWIWSRIVPRIKK